MAYASSDAVARGSACAREDDVPLGQRERRGAAAPMGSGPRRRPRRSPRARRRRAARRREHELGAVPPFAKLRAPSMRSCESRHVLAGRHARDERVAQRVGAELVDRVDRVDHRCPWSWTSSGPRRRARAVQEDGVERHLARELDPEHHHARDPEEEDVVARLEALRRVEAREVGALGLRPAEAAKGHRPDENHVSSTSLSAA